MLDVLAELVAVPSHVSQPDGIAAVIAQMRSSRVASAISALAKTPV